MDTAAGEWEDSMRWKGSTPVRWSNYKADGLGKCPVHWSFQADRMCDPTKICHKSPKQSQRSHLAGYSNLNACVLAKRNRNRNRTIFFYLKISIPSSHRATKWYTYLFTNPFRNNSHHINLFTSYTGPDVKKGFLFSRTRQGNPSRLLGFYGLSRVSCFGYKNARYGVFDHPHLARTNNGEIKDRTQYFACSSPFVQY
ncbi:unnamed protein product [Kuraishia capsulata CBS 1993]|uniref:Uncharacterized protein n=1 Tax=Kuraishia capsulata CBS 1993 TaxID=1382522 RepID=W6MTH5_9ASCO|nr:uncharacterized protein KUCA_T00005746001 [Kuraishia capsulata CBS 1993]CDK29753.1 unnamed protein product [Kuraishia capsulata CBS 1993]